MARTFLVRLPDQRFVVAFVRNASIPHQQYCVTVAYLDRAQAAAMPYNTAIAVAKRNSGIVVAA